MVSACTVAVPLATTEACAWYRRLAGVGNENEPRQLCKPWFVFIHGSIASGNLLL